MNQQWQEWEGKINSMTQRERIILLVTALVVVVMGMQVLLIDPLMAERQKVHMEIKQLTSTLEQQKNETVIVNAQLTAGVNRHKEQRRDQLAEQVETLDRQIQESVVAMIPPQMMPQVLENVLEKNSELKLVSLENKPVVSVLEEGAEEDAPPVRGAVQTPQAGDEKKQGLYSHGFVLTLSGNYRAAIRYFEQLSELPWRFYWDDMRYRVDRYPNATITLEVHTVSMSEDWIGV